MRYIITSLTSSVGPTPACRLLAIARSMMYRISLVRSQHELSLYIRVLETDNPRATFLPPLPLVSIGYATKSGRSDVNPPRGQDDCSSLGKTAYETGHFIAEDADVVGHADDTVLTPSAFPGFS